MLVTQQGATASTEQLALVDAYRRRFEGWFRFATDGRANGVTSLDVFEPCPEPALEVDAGVVVADAGVEPGDAGTEPEPDAGPTPPRSAPLDAGEYDPMTRKFRPGCECGSAPLGLALAAVLALARRRPSRRVSSGAQKR